MLFNTNLIKTLLLVVVLKFLPTFNITYLLISSLFSYESPFIFFERWLTGRDKDICLYILYTSLTVTSELSFTGGVKFCLLVPKNCLSQNLSSCNLIFPCWLNLFQPGWRDKILQVPLLHFLESLFSALNGRLCHRNL